AAILAPILTARPDAYHQYATHAGWHFGSGNYLQQYLRAWQFGKPYLAFTGVCWLIALASRGADSRPPLAGPVVPPWRQLWLGPLAGLVFLAIFLPGKYFYLWFMGPWLLVGAVLTMYRLAPRWGYWQSRVLFCAAVLGYTPAAAPFLKN